MMPTRSDRPTTRFGWVGWGVGATLTVLAIAVLDKPASTFAHAAFHDHRTAFDALTHLVDPLPPIASVGAIALAIAMVRGYRLGPTARVFLLCALSVLIVVTLKDQAKYLFGRLWPETWVDNNPSWIADGKAGFFPLHGGRGWASFPSGHTAVMSAPAAVLWRLTRVFRIPAASCVLLVAVGLFGADYHFVGDIVGGILLGSAVGWATVEYVEIARLYPATEPTGNIPPTLDNTAGGHVPALRT